MNQDRSTLAVTSRPIAPRPRRLACLGVLLASLVAGCASSVASPDAYAQAGEIDPPARVGSISALRGPVDVSAEAGSAWEPAKLNRPVTTGTSLWAPPGSQAEVRVGSTSVRLDGNTQAVFQKLDDDEVAIDVAQGTVRARVRRFDSNDRFVFAADGVRAEAQGPGDYRVSYDPDRRAYTVRTLAGRMRIATPGNSFNLEAGQESIVEAGGAQLALRAMGPRDDFDAWAEARDREQDRLAAARYVSPEMTGIEALDAHGRWEVVPEYGAVWYPRTVPYGWAPYRYGHWAYISPWGWTWVDDAPWGFAPFHYGRWAMVGSGWCWVPGPVVPRPVYAPALVGYVGGGRSGVSVSVGIGVGAPVGWFPLGPGEVYHPPYRYSPRYVTQVNVINVYGGPRPPMDGGVPAYRYANRPDAVTVVREEQFRGARPIGTDRVNLTPQQAAGLQPVLVTPGGRPGGGGGTAPGPTARLPMPDGRFDGRPGPQPRGDGGRAWPGPAYGSGVPQPQGQGQGDRGPRGPAPTAGTASPPPFERGPSTGRDLIPANPGQGARPSTSVVPLPAVVQQPQPQPQAQPQIPQRQLDGRGFNGGDPRVPDERYIDRGDRDRGFRGLVPPPQAQPQPQPQPQARPMPEMPRVAAPTPAPQPAPRAMPAPPQAQPQIQAQQQPQPQQAHRGRRDDDGEGKGPRNGGPIKER